jgi:cytochrome c553
VDQDVDMSWNDFDSLTAGLSRLAAGQNDDHTLREVKQQAVGEERDETTGIATQVVSEDLEELANTLQSADFAESKDSEAAAARERARRAAWLAVFLDCDDEQD